MRNAYEMLTETKFTNDLSTAWKQWNYSFAHFVIQLVVEEGDTVSFGCLSHANVGMTKFVIQIYPLLYNQKIDLGGNLTGKNKWGNLQVDVIYT